MFISEISRQNVDLSPPTTSQATENSSSQQNLSTFDVSIKKDEDHSVFDNNQLLSMIPNKSIKSAKQLLFKLLEQPNEITWNGSGMLFINGISIPKSNFFLIFRKLFVQSKSKLPGFDEFLNKLNELGLNNYVKPKIETDTSQTLIESSNSVLPVLEEQSNVQWWYIGD